jgi:hypothetical protein
MSVNIAPEFFDQWAFPPDFEPRKFIKRLIPEGRNLPVLFQITSGITYEPGSVVGEYGVYVYCNDRLVLRASKAGEFGFVPGMAGVPHPRMSHARIILEFSGAAKDMPWNSSKTGLNFNHAVFRAVRTDIYTAVKNATALSSRLQPTFETSIEPFQTGAIVEEELGAEQSLPQSRLPAIPPIRPSPKEAFREANKTVAANQPWAIGAYEAIIAIEVIRKQHLTQQSRLVLLILDSTLEIAFKDYLAHQIAQPMSEAALQALFRNRIDVNKEVEKTILTGDPLWKKVNYYYKQRCELVHKRVSVSVSDIEVDDYQATVEKLLGAMFGLSFPRK